MNKKELDQFNKDLALWCLNLNVREFEQSILKALFIQQMDYALSKDSSLSYIEEMYKFEKYLFPIIPFINKDSKEGV